MYQQPSPYPSVPVFGGPEGNPAPGYPSGPAPGYPSGPAPSYPSGPAPSYPSGPAPGYPPGPAPGYPPGPTPGYPPGPTPGYPPAPTSGYPPADGYPQSPNSCQQVSPGGPGGFPQVSPTGPTPYPDSGSPPLPGLLPEPGPTAPDLGQMEKVKGYENIGFQEGIIQPPVAPGWEEHPEPERPEIFALVILTDDEIRDAVHDFASSHCCYGKKFSNEMNTRNIEKLSAFHYILESFTEKRESAWKFDPYEGQAIDGPMNGPAPGPWDIHAQPQKDYEDSKEQIEVPHTAFVKPCHTCVGNGRVRCNQCQGRGNTNCIWCHGSGRKNNEPCNSCNSSGHRRCLHCSGSGQEKCKTCQGRGQLKGYVQLTVTWTNHYDDYISETESLPKEKIRNVSGNDIFDEERPRVWPLFNSGDSGVDNASRDLVNKHGRDFTNERILKQNHSLTIVPVTRVDYEWKGKEDEFYVYGDEQKVHFDKYPQNCCWGCSIL